jgi:hypothetical protein
LKGNAIEEYKKYFHNGDRREIFKLVAEKYDIRSALYPGSYIHIAPSFYIPLTVYVDSFKKTKLFFNDEDGVYNFIYKLRVYEEEPEIRFHPNDYNSDFNESLRSFDLLISQYAGFISQCCKKYLKEDGILLANNSHGDASMAYIDKDFEFIGVIYLSNKQYRLTEKNLDKYFIPKKPDLKITKAYLERTQKGIGYTKSARVYLFRNQSR